MTCSKGTQAESRTLVRCRASAHGSRTLPTELSGAPKYYNFWPSISRTAIAEFNMFYSVLEVSLVVFEQL